MCLLPYASRVWLLAATAVAAFPAQAGLDDWLKDKIKQPEARALDPGTVAAGLRDALEQGTRRAVQDLGRENGFWSHPTLRIPVPENLAKIEKGLRRFGQDKVADDFVRSLNRAAEAATPAARDIFVDAIRRMTIKDAVEILKGPSDAGTRYFRRHTETPLTAAFRPIVVRSTETVGVTARYKRFARKAEPLGLVSPGELDLDDYITRKALDGLFQLVAAEERRIREDPAARTTDLLRKVFR